MGANGKYRIFVDFKGYFNLRNTARGSRNSRQVELTELVVVFYEGTFTFIHGNSNLCLLVLIS